MFIYMKLIQKVFLEIVERKFFSIGFFIETEMGSFGFCLMVWRFYLIYFNVQTEKRKINNYCYICY